MTERVVGGREIRAFTLAPLPVLVALLLAIGINATLGGAGDASGADTFLFMLALLMLSYGTAFAIGIPVHLLLRRFRKTSLIYYMVLAAFPFVLIAAAIAVRLRLGPAPLPPINPFGLYMQGGLVIKWMLAFAASASLSASIFWYAGVRSPKS